MVGYGIKLVLDDMSSGFSSLLHEDIFNVLQHLRLLKALGRSIFESMRLLSTAVDLLADTTVRRTVAP